MHHFSFLFRGICLALAVAAAGCGGSHRLDATSHETLQASLDGARKGFLTQTEIKRFDRARAFYESTYFGPTAAVHTDPYLPEWDIVNGMRTGQFLQFVDALERDAAQVAPQEPVAIFPNPALTTRILEQYQLERTLLIQARDRIQEKGKNTINEYPIVDFAFIPPNANQPIEYDKARFIVSLRNDSGFDAYRPSFELVIRDPGQEVPVLERTFAFEHLEDPIGPGETKMLEMSCCSVSTDPFHNAMLKNLTEEASIEVNLKSMMNHGTTPILDITGFAMQDHLRLGVVSRCIRQIEKQIETWVPRAQDDQPGGCGDDSGSETAFGLAKNP